VKEESKKTVKRRFTMIEDNEIKKISRSSVRRYRERFTQLSVYTENIGDKVKDIFPEYEWPVDFDY